jgi:alpha-tubulin suppressor-like RCC1 family protein
MDGTVNCWGYNASGQVGDGTTVNRSMPTPALTVTTATKVASGSNHSCALLADGSLRCWGNDTAGQLGDAMTGDRATPAPVNSPVTGVQELAARATRTCARGMGTTIWCWGEGGTSHPAAIMW